MTNIFELAAQHGASVEVEKFTPRSRRQPSFLREVVAPVFVFAATTGAATGGFVLSAITWGDWPAFAAPFALCTGGVAGFVAAYHSLPRYWDLQWTEERQRLDPQPEQVKPPAVFLKQPTGWAGIPRDVRDERLPHFCRAALRDDILTEAGAGRFGFNRREWEILRDWCIGQGLLEWKAPDNHKLGVRFTSGGKVGFETIADSPIPNRPPLRSDG